MIARIIEAFTRPEMLRTPVDDLITMATVIVVVIVAMFLGELFIIGLEYIKDKKGIDSNGKGR